jgi:NAD(P)H dehydrogenase (quinone)
MNTHVTSTEHTAESALLVTGAAGRTGGYVAQLLLERRHRVRAPER